jgi:8-oxo-dGTP pyrophosphatase MutT (NUDIX family)
VIRAAGGVLRRDGLVAVVHRPHRRDWTLPKGKLEPGEDDAAAAVREVREETGSPGVIERDLGTVSYPAAGGGTKTVRYFLMAAGEPVSELAPDVDEVRWMPPDGAAQLLTYATDREVLGRARPHLQA